MSSLGLEICRLRPTLPMAPIRRLHYSEAQARGRRQPSVVRAAAENEPCSGPSRQGFAWGPFRISPMFHWPTPGQVNCLASATRANGNIPSPRRPLGTTLEERSIGSTCIASPLAQADWGPKPKRCVDKGDKGSKLRSLPVRVQILPQEGIKLLRSDICLPSLNAMVRKLSIPLVKIPDHTEPHAHI
jgi:hypothetical protein